MANKKLKKKARKKLTDNINGDETKIKIEPATKPTEKKGEINVVDHIIPKKTCDQFHFIISKWDKDKEKGICYIESIDPRTYFEPSLINELKKSDNLDEIKQHHEKSRKMVDWREKEEVKKDETND